MPRKKSNRQYFTKETEDAIILYNKTEDKLTRDKIYKDNIYSRIIFSDVLIISIKVFV